MIKFYVVLEYISNFDDVVLRSQFDVLSKSSSELMDSLTRMVGNGKIISMNIRVYQGVHDECLL